jgi:hypothetical protein
MRKHSIARRIAMAPTVAQATPRREASGMDLASLLLRSRRVVSELRRGRGSIGLGRRGEGPGDPGVQGPLSFVRISPVRPGSMSPAVRMSAPKYGCEAPEIASEEGSHETALIAAARARPIRGPQGSPPLPVSLRDGVAPPGGPDPTDGRKVYGRPALRAEGGTFPLLLGGRPKREASSSQLDPRRGDPRRRRDPRWLLIGGAEARDPHRAAAAACPFRRRVPRALGGC